MSRKVEKLREELDVLTERDGMYMPFTSTGRNCK